MARRWFASSGQLRRRNIVRWTLQTFDRTGSAYTGVIMMILIRRPQPQPMPGGSTIASAENDLVGGGMASMLTLNDSRPLAPLTVVLHVSPNYTHHFNCMLYSGEGLLFVYMHLYWRYSEVI